jgi:hypothetical protein
MNDAPAVALPALSAIADFVRGVWPIALWMTIAPWPMGPEPHLVEKVRWVARGGAGMRPIDVFDLLLHGSAAGLLLWAAIDLALARATGAPGR